MSKTARIKTLLCDLDGVIWLAHQPIDGSVEAISRLEAAGVEVLFVTNNSFSTQAQQRDALAKIGIVTNGNVITSAMAAASRVAAGERVMVCGGEGLIEEVAKVGADVVVPYRQRDLSGAFDAVVVGFHREFDFDVLSQALTAVRNGARLIGSNNDPTYPTPHGPIPGGGSILAAIEHATGVKALVTGKPHQTMAQCVHDVVSDVDVSEMMMVGDVVSTDGAFAQTIGCRFGLVMSGMTTNEQGSGADVVGQNLAEVVDHILQ